MRILIQRVKRASVTISGKIKSKIDTGLLILVGIEEADTKEDAEWLAKKATSLRIFDDENGIMNRSVKDIGGSVLIVSQFTLHASTKKGNRPSYIKAGKTRACNTYVRSLMSLHRTRNRKIRSDRRIWG